MLLSGDQPYVCQDRTWVSFMWSYPNLVPLGPAAIRQVAAARWATDRAAATGVELEAAVADPVSCTALASGADVKAALWPGMSKVMPAAPRAPSPGNAEIRQKKTSSPNPQVALRFDRMAVVMRVSARSAGPWAGPDRPPVLTGPVTPGDPGAGALDGMGSVAMAIRRLSCVGP